MHNTQNSSENKLLPMTGIVLAGGKSSRMGRNKAFLEWQGQLLIERSLQVLGTIFSEIIISTNSPELYESYGVKTVQDIYAEQGPLGGLHACLREAQKDYSFFVACDMPFLDPEVIRFLADLTGKESVIVPDVAGGLHPLHAFYHKNCLPIIEKKLETKRLKLIELFQECTVRYVREEELKGFPQISQTFSNINTPQEWLEIQPFGVQSVQDKYKY
jgi:molybdopterin-guanine dinucleotide biosynthesis protein A